MTTFTIHEAKTNLSKLIAAALEGDEVVIARGETPVVKLIPVSAKPARLKFGALKDEVGFDDSFFDPLPEDELRAWNCEDD
jgi:prevent-host-death family protein